MFVEQTKINQNKYKDMLTAMASLSRLSSESSIPYLGYREVENIYCRAFDAENISRGDCSADAAKDGVGVGIKTFLEGNGRSLQKVAEFNKDMDLFKDKSDKEIVRIISYLRNERIESTKRIHGLYKMIYHCVIRSMGEIKVFECPMDLINIDKIKKIKRKKNTITFQDDINEYSINISKSTLYKRFITENVLMNINVSIIENPYEVLSDLLTNDKKLKFAPICKDKEYVILPLYSYSKSKGKYVPGKSGLNQWNAGGRERKAEEVYIHIPSWIHKVFEEFFPEREKVFTLILPDKQKLNAKVCQDGRKALMTNPNSDLGEWILRDVMNLEENELLTYERLEELNIDSVVIYKENKDEYSIDFTQIESFEKFKEEYKKLK